MFQAEYWFNHPAFPGGGKWMHLWPGNVVIRGTKDFCLETVKDSGLGIDIQGQPLQIRFTEVQEESSSRNSNS